MTQFRTTVGRGGLWGLMGSLALIAACSDSDSSPATVVPPEERTHPEVVLRDVHGEPIPIDSTAPYSPRSTCGRCHDVDTIANAYHFSQGRTDLTGRIDDRLTKPWEAQMAVLSPGMYGKW